MNIIYILKLNNMYMKSKGFKLIFLMLDCSILGLFLGISIIIQTVKGIKFLLTTNAILFPVLGLVTFLLSLPLKISVLKEMK